MLNGIKQFFGFEEIDHSKINTTPVADPPNFKQQKRNLNLTIRIETPRIYEDSLSIGNSLRDGSPVIICLKHLSPDAGKRLVDFICGTTYAINGSMLKIGDGIFLFAPPGVTLSDTDESYTQSNNGDQLLHTLNQLE